MKRILLAALAGMAAAATPVAAFGQAPAAASSSAHLAEARRLVEMTNPFDRLLEANVAGWETAIRQTMAIEPSFKKMEAEYPGISEAAVEAARPLAREYCAHFVRRAMEKKAEMFAAGLTPPELAEIIRFHETPLGRKVVRQMYDNVNFNAVAKDLATQAVRTGNGKLSAATVTEAERSAAERTAAQITTDEELALLRFGQTPVAAKFTTLRARSEEAILAMVNNPDPAWVAKQQQAVISAMTAFAGKAKAR